MPLNEYSPYLEYILRGNLPLDNDFNTSEVL